MNINKKISLADNAKKALCKKLGIDENCASKKYADIVAQKEGEERFFYEIKATEMTENQYNSINTLKDKYFGAATLTEWNLAIKYPERYKFVLVIMDKDNPDKMLGFEEYTPLEMLTYSTIPPFKVNFNIPFIKTKITTPNRRDGTVPAMGKKEKNPDGRLLRLIRFFEKLGGKLLEP